MGNRKKYKILVYILLIVSIVALIYVVKGLSFSYEINVEETKWTNSPYYLIVKSNKRDVMYSFNENEYTSNNKYLIDKNYDNLIIHIKYDGEIHEEVVQIANIDMVPPSIDNVLTNCNSLKSKGPINFSILANDESSGINKFMFIGDNKTYSTNNNKIEFSDDMKDNIMVAVEDKAGNRAYYPVNYEVNIDEKYNSIYATNNPISVEKEIEEVTNKSYKIKISSDNKNYNFIKYAISKNYDFNYGDSNMFKINENGTYYIHVLCADGQKFTRKYQINNIDNTKPILKIKETIKENSINLKFEVIDDNVDSKGLILNGKQDYLKDLNIYRNNKEYKIQVKDKAGNLSEEILYKSNKINKEIKEPSLIVSMSTLMPTNSDVELKIITNLNMPVFSYNYVAFTSKSSNVISSNNSYYPIVARDENGNEIMEIIEIINIDKIPPSFNVIESLSNDETSLQLTVNAKDNYNNDLLYSFNNSMWSSDNTVIIKDNVNSYSIRVKDIAGNINEIKYDINSIKTRKVYLQHENKKIINAIQKRYGFNIEYGYGSKQHMIGGAYTVDIDNEEIVNTALKVIEKELLKYPDNFFMKMVKNSGYKIILKADLFGSTGISVDDKSNYLFLRADSLTLSRTFHHETMHLITYYYNEVYGEDSKDNPLNDFSKFNPKGFKYGKNHISNIRNVYGRDKKVTLDKACFVESYSKLNIKEDQATTFAIMMTKKNKSEYYSKSPCISNKINHLSSALKQYYAGQHYWSNYFE